MDLRVVGCDFRPWRLHEMFLDHVLVVQVLASARSIHADRTRQLFEKLAVLESTQLGLRRFDQQSL
jgi:hypothetical protein